MAAVSRNVSAVAARSHTRRMTSPQSSSSPRGTSRIAKNLSVVLLIGLVAWAYQAIQPTPPRTCGSPGGPPVVSPRIKLKDGRHLAYKEYGAPKKEAKNKIVFIHGFDCCKYDVIQISPALLEDLGIYLLAFDRPGYGESDPNPNRTVKSIALDIEELADQLELGEKFYVIGYSMGGEIAWTCVRYIPHRLAGAAIIAPVANYWWHGFPPNVSETAFNLQRPRDQWAVRVAHYAPWLIYWWNTQKWFYGSNVVAQSTDVFSAEDMKLLPKMAGRELYKGQIRQQGEFESLHRDMIVGFGNWEFSPMDLENPFPNGEGSIHLWHGAKDLIVPVTFSRYIGENLPWIHYHEVPDAGHLFLAADGMADAIAKSLLLGD